METKEELFFNYYEKSQKYRRVNPVFLQYQRLTTTWSVHTTHYTTHPDSRDTDLQNNVSKVRTTETSINGIYM